jgi:hypothetical protein
MSDDKREDRQFRNHDTYKQENWTVVDIDGVDNVFVTPTLDRYKESIRIDIDGFGAESVMNDLDITHDNINTSVWVPLPEAVMLRNQLTEAIETVRNQ